MPGPFACIFAEVLFGRLYVLFCFYQYIDCFSLVSTVVGEGKKNKLKFMMPKDM